MSNNSNNVIGEAGWDLALEELLRSPEDPILLLDFGGQDWRSAARPVLARGIDQKQYIVKGKQAGRQIVNDQIVARLGVAMGAPVGEPKIVEISPDLLELYPQYDFLKPGTAHATRFISNCSDDREPIQFAQHTDNRARFALLSVLFGWVYSQDKQFLYQKHYPNLVYSVDHGHFFPNGPQWTIANLRTISRAEVDPDLVSVCGLNQDEVKSALLMLAGVTEATIIQAVASPPNEWGLTMEERIVLVEYLLRRQQELLDAL
ncbi:MULTISPECIES: HipA family kinase [Trichocoleus]|uniref:HipA-like kinase domain-containing protein n=1 Tax=Trichocoleus desertorum GB2-A4 TaxID=2933944 RepID=A0ABV0JF77_9CYAN|nr:HipA family kinase [Trichocoleus sp. FACHB-46]MBD1862334.1 hypothetical protein [Trichocoleus sp. FACHB-46]